MKLNRELFLGALEQVLCGLAPKETIEQSSCFVFRGGNVITYNEEIYCRNASGLDATCKGAVKGGPLITLLRNMTEDEIEIEMTEALCHVKGTKRGAKLRMEAEILLPVNSVEKPKDWSPIHEELAEAIQMVHQCASVDESKIDLACVHFHPDWLEACDLSQLCRWTMPTGVKESTLLRHKSIKNIVNLGMTEFSETPNWIHFRNGNGMRLSCRRYLEEFPDLKDALQVKGARAVVLPKGLVETMKKASIFTKENTETDTDLVTVDMKPGKIRITGTGISGEYYEWKKLNYTGPALKFLIAPDLLSSLVAKHNQVEVSAEKLRVKGEKFIYVAALGVPGTNGDGSEGKEDETQEVE